MLPRRLQEKISPEPNTGCWLWSATCTWDGYGQVGWRGGMKYAHRVVFELLRGPVPSGLQLDHLCRVRCCVNPDHLEPVTGRENTRRGLTGSHNRAKTHCPAGHEYAGYNLHISGSGRRICRLCNRIRMQRKGAA